MIGRAPNIIPVGVIPGLLLSPIILSIHHLSIMTNIMVIFESITNNDINITQFKREFIT